MALATHEGLIRAIEGEYPTMTLEDQNEVLIDILYRIACIRGWEIRRVYIDAEDDE